MFLYVYNFKQAKSQPQVLPKCTTVLRLCFEKQVDLTLFCFWLTNCLHIQSRLCPSLSLKKETTKKMPWSMSRPHQSEGSDLYEPEPPGLGISALHISCNFTVDEQWQTCSSRQTVHRIQSLLCSAIYRHMEVMTMEENLGLNIAMVSLKTCSIQWVVSNYDIGGWYWLNPVRVDRMEGKQVFFIYNQWFNLTIVGP